MQHDSDSSGSMPESGAEPPAQGATQDKVSSGSLGASGAEADDWRARKREYDRHDDGLGPYMQWAFKTSKEVIALRRGYWTEFQSWADRHLGQGFSMACADGDLLDQVTQSCFDGYIAGREYREPSTAAPIEAASEAPSQPQASEREPDQDEPSADAARLDAMEANGWHAENAPLLGFWRVGRADAFGQPEFRANTLRAAIDRAREAAKGEQS
jgi:hypothetical protein